MKGLQNSSALIEFGCWGPGEDEAVVPELDGGHQGGVSHLFDVGEGVKAKTFHPKMKIWP